MSCNYADGLSHYDNKGKLGLAEKFEDDNSVRGKCNELAKWISEAKHVVVHTGAGISTSAGIPDFRGPKGVWTLEAKGLKPNINTSFDDAVPTKTHMALVQLVKAGLVHFVVSQNIDGLHLKSGLPRNKMAELHGNMFVDQCHQCGRNFVRSTATKSVGQKCSEVACPANRLNGRPCRGKLYDTILDWEHNLPEKELALADFHSCIADLSICLGTTLQIVPSGSLPLHTKKHGKTGKLAIVNLQPTKHDRQADLRINSYVDKVLEYVCDHLGLQIPEYSSDNDPTKLNDVRGIWTISQAEVTKMRKWYEEVCCKSKRKNHTRSKNGAENGNDNHKKTKLAKTDKDDCNTSAKIKEEPLPSEFKEEKKTVPNVGHVKSESSTDDGETNIINTTDTVKENLSTDNEKCHTEVIPKVEVDYPLN